MMHETCSPECAPSTPGALAVALMAPEELEQVAVLFDAYRAFYGQPHDLDLARRFLSERLEWQDAWVLVARRGSAPVAGFCQIYPSFSSVAACRIGILNDLFVRADARSQGVGAALLTAAHDLAMTRGLARLELSTAHDNLPARSLYAHLGWLPDDRFLTYRRTVAQPVYAH